MIVPHSTWLQSRGFDLCFFGTIWLVPAVILTRGTMATPGMLLLFLAFLYGPHLFSTVHHVGRLPAWARTQPLAFVLPAALGVLFTLPAVPGQLLPTKVSELLLIVATLWGIVHVGQHNLSILQHYRERTGKAASSVTAQREQRILMLLMIAAAEGVISPFVERNLTVKAFIDVTRICVQLLAGAELIAYLASALRSRQGARELLPSALFLVSAAAAMTPWLQYGLSPSLRIGLFFLVFNAHHSLASLGLTFLMKRESDTQSIAPRELVSFLAPLVAMSILILWLATGAFTLSGIEKLLAPVTVERTLRLLTGCFVLHYYFEMLAWAPKRVENAAPIASNVVRVAH